jgi:DNA ligase-1
MALNLPREPWACCDGVVPTLLADVVGTSAAVAATSKRLAKTEALAGLLRTLEPAEIEPVTAWLCGEARQGRIGVGWATAYQTQAPAATVASLTVADLDDALDTLDQTAGPGSQVQRAAVLGRLLAAATPAEQDFLRRLLTGELRQGALAGVLTDAVAKAAGVPAAAVRRAAMLAGDLPATARTALVSGAGGLAATGLQVGRPVQPMLAATATGVPDALGATPGGASVEWKLDGARLQVHRDGDEVALYTRNLNDVTARLPDVVALVRSLPARRFILDGEVIGLAHDASGEMAPELFQHTMAAFSRDDQRAPAVQLQPFFFDLLHLDGEDLIDQPLQARAAALAGAAGSRRIPAIVTADPAEAEAFLAGALAQGHEGVMVKALDSSYEAGRRGKAWRKVKPVRTLDLVVLAAEWGHGRRRGWLSNLHLGARDPADASRFVMVGKTFKGLTDEMLAWQTAALLERKVQESGITVTVRPELVVEIALDGVQVSSRYPGGVALRFARVKRYRADKVPAAADTIDAVAALLPGHHA